MSTTDDKKMKKELQKQFVKELNDSHKKYSEKSISESFKLVQEGGPALGELEQVELLFLILFLY
jgi:hypothetical protein